MAKCSAITKSGYRCLNSAKYGSYCGSHRSYFKKNVLSKIPRDAITSGAWLRSNIPLIESLDQYELGFITNYMEPMDKLIIQTTCAYCSLLVQNNTGEIMNMNTFLSIAAKSADHTRARDLCELAHSMHTPSTPVDFNWMLWGAAEGGHRDLCIIAREWIGEANMELMSAHASNVRIGLKEMLWSAAEGGHRDICILAREWLNAGGDEIPFDDMLGNAVLCGDPVRRRDVCLLAKEWIEASNAKVDFGWMMQCALKAGHRDMCILAKEWLEADGGAADLDEALYFAASGADSVRAKDVCVLVHEWIKASGTLGASTINYKFMFVGAANHGHRELCILARDWSVESDPEGIGLPNFDEMYRVIMEWGHDDLRELAQKWSQERRDHN